MAKTRKFLRRYTHLPALIQMLRDRSITFLDPESWDDKNDRHFMQLYREKKELKTLLALCCSEKTETYHHWRVFSDGPSGVCVSFERDALIGQLAAVSEIRHGKVRYLKIKDLKKSTLEIDDLPFVKRSPYEPEREFRFIYESGSRRVHSESFTISLSCIDNITLSPWMPNAVADSVKDQLREIRGAAKLRIRRSTLIRNEQWTECGDRIAGV